MSRSMLVCVLAGCIGVEEAALEQGLAQPQGMSLQGMSLQGMSLQGMQLEGFRIQSARLDNQPVQLQVERGELVARHGNRILRGRDLVGAELRADARGDNPRRMASVDYRIADVAPEDPAHDPTGTGSTFVYALEQWVADTGTWQPACGVDGDGRRGALPLAAVWDARGDRQTSNTQFTLACTTGALAKCYRWGYRPWVTGYGDLDALHWACTRLARADYCGDGTPHTYDGTWINIWDTLPAPGPVQGRATDRPEMTFEAGWSTRGVTCLAHPRWASQNMGSCTNRATPPRCESLAEAMAIDPATRLFTESQAQ